MNAAKRFYKTAEAVEAAGGHGIALDGKPVRTPAGHPLAVPGAALAGAVTEEWAAQGETIDRETMPLTRLVCTALDLVPGRRAEIVAEVAAYAETDLVCYRTNEPPALARRQAASLGAVGGLDRRAVWSPPRGYELDYPCCPGAGGTRRPARCGRGRRTTSLLPG